MLAFEPFSVIGFISICLWMILFSPKHRHIVQAKKQTGLHKQYMLVWELFLVTMPGLICICLSIILFFPKNVHIVQAKKQTGLHKQYMLVLELLLVTMDYWGSSKRIAYFWCDKNNKTLLVIIWTLISGNILWLPIHVILFILQA